MQKKYIALIVVAVVIAGIGVLEYTQGTVSALAFDQMKYTYSSHVVIPPLTSNGSYIGGYYIINGTGRDFKMLVVLPGAESTESPLDYTADGLQITGHIDSIKVTPDTLTSLYQKKVKNAMFNTTFTGHMNMSCAAWTGTSQFQNDGEHFTGTFHINGVMTDWDGNYTLVTDASRIMIISDYVYYAKNQTQNKKSLHSVYYL